MSFLCTFLFTAIMSANAVAAPAALEIRVFDDLKLLCGEKKDFAFDAPAIPEGHEAVLSLKARLDNPHVAGYTNAMKIMVNGHVLDAHALINKPLRAKARGGDVYSMAAGEVFSTYYTPDFASPDTDPHYGLLDGVKACDFELRISDLLEQGKNTLTIEHVGGVNNALIAAQARVLFRVPPPPAKANAGPPTGPLSKFEPKTKLETSYTVEELPGAQLAVKVGGESFVVVSQFSTPKPGWVHGSCPFFTLERKIERKPEAIVVRDTFTNRTNENLPLMHRNQAALGERFKRLWIGGIEQASAAASTANPSNPTTYAVAMAGGIGLLPLDDVFRVHIVNYATGGTIGIGDDTLVLKPGATYTAEWAIVPTLAGDYWEFINAARRLVDANFLIDGAFVFLRAGPLTDAWTDAQISDFLRFKDGPYVCASIDYPRYKGRYTHGTAFQQVPHDNYVHSFARWKKLVPGIKTMVYFHCFIDVTDEGPERYADARVLRPDGAQADYGEPYDKIYFPTDSNSFGPAIAKNVDMILDEIKADGVYWDEHEYSRWNYHYGEPWDGYSGDIDPVKMTVTRLKSSVTLLTAAWRTALARKILAHGPLVGNGPPFTREMAALKFPCFVETGSITNCTQAHLYSPIALGDHLTERSETDAYGVMLAALDYGCVYHWYNDLTVIPTHRQLTRYMYPITPMELHAGYIIGKERIITKISGMFGWGDNSGHEAHVFDENGREVESLPAPLIRDGGKSYTELRIGEGWSAAIVRKQPLPTK